MNEKDGPSIWLKSSGGDRKRMHLGRELAAFWLRHPNSKFVKSTLCYALDYGKLEMDKALRLMIGFVPHRSTCAQRNPVLLDE